MIKKGTWVNLHKIILEPENRAAGIPEDTAAVPLIMWVSGFLQGDSNIGQEATIRTRMNRIETGILEEANPSTKVGYGEYVPEIINIGLQARDILFGGGANG